MEVVVRAGFAMHDAIDMGLGRFDVVWPSPGSTR
jgi:hypothetical protein